jgi:hypothetical protein
MKRKMTVVALTAILLMNVACDPNLIKTADDVLFSLKAAQPLITQFLPSAGPKITQGIDIATKLEDALKASNSTTALGFLSELIPTFQAIVTDDIPQIHDANVRTEIMTALALADIALHILVSHLKTNAPAAMASPQGNAMSRFASEPVWGNSYKTKKR